MHISHITGLNEFHILCFPSTTNAKSQIWSIWPNRFREIRNVQKFMTNAKEAICNDRQYRIAHVTKKANKTLLPLYFHLFHHIPLSIRCLHAVKDVFVHYSVTVCNLHLKMYHCSKEE